MKKILYYAVNGSGQGVVSTCFPARDEKRKVWLCEISGTYCSLVMQMESEGLVSLPAMKWGDEPVAIEVSMKIREGADNGGD